MRRRPRASSITMSEGALTSSRQFPRYSLHFSYILSLLASVTLTETVGNRYKAACDFLERNNLLSIIRACVFTQSLHLC
jgi:hypothetical protein